jgi:uncharacterized protein (DUF305 family)
MKHAHYGKLFLMAALSFVAMFILMYAMVDSFGNVYPNVNQFYMAALMTAPMLVLELVLMGSMYENKTLNAVIIVASLAALALFWGLTRNQTAVGDRQFLKSMIPHHAGAILMCNEATLTEPGTKDLCKRILASQEAEIREMKELLRKTEKS